MKYQVDGYGNAWTENKSPSAGGLIPLAGTWFDLATNRLNGVVYYGNGNQKQWKVNDATSRAEYDADGHLRKAGIWVAPQAPAEPYYDTTKTFTEMTYNGLGQKVKMAVTGPGSQTVHYVYGLGGEVVAEWGGEVSASGRQFLVADQLGSTRVRFDGNGEVLQRIGYEPYGVEVQRPFASGYAASNEVREKYTGKERVPEVAADYFSARYLGMGLGRFTTPDGLMISPTRLKDPAGLSLYSYVRNRPSISVDANGLATIVVTVGANQGARVSVYSDRMMNRGTFNGLARGVGGRNRMIRNSDTPFGKYRITQAQGGQQLGRAYGTGKVRLEPVAGEIMSSGRDLIRVHGGGSRLPDPYLPRQELVATEGCIRVANADAELISEILKDYKLDGDDYLYVGTEEYLRTFALGDTNLAIALSQENNSVFRQQLRNGFEQLMLELWRKKSEEETRGEAESRFIPKR